MAPIPQGGTVAVTGAAGFIGGWIVRTLLDKGYRVRACVRDPDDVGVGVIPCDGFLLWRLPDAPYCNEAGTQSGAYCTTLSGL
jgi:NAD(P)-dependent dehydrogenase (short-subunit alcohol dehydrogenase family)